MDGEINLPLISSAENSLRHQTLEIVLPLLVTPSLCFPPSSLADSASPPAAPPPQDTSIQNESAVNSSVSDAEKPSGLKLSLSFIVSAITSNAGSASPSLNVSVCVHARMCGQTLRSNTAYDEAVNKPSGTVRIFRASGYGGDARRGS